MGRTGGVVVGRKGSPHRSLFGEICNADEKEGMDAMQVGWAHARYACMEVRFFVFFFGVAGDCLGVIGIEKRGWENLALNLDLV